MSESASPLPWTGNKGCIYSTIDAFIPPHRVYIEPCMGSAEVFFRKPPAEKEILNDYNGDLVNFFRVLQDMDKLTFLLGRLALSINSEEQFRRNRELLNSVPNVLDDISETGEIIAKLSWNDVQLAAAFYANQVYSYASTGKSFAIVQRDMRQRLDRLYKAHGRLCNAVILHRDYREVIRYAAGKDTFILLDPPYKGTENYYKKSNFNSDDHEKLFDFMAEIDKQFHGECKFLITYNNCDFIRELAEKHGFDTYVQPRLHNMVQITRPGEQFEELLIGNYPLLQQAEINNKYLPLNISQMSLFDFHYDY